MNETIKLILVFCAVAFVVLIIANIELYVNKNNAVFEGELMKTYMMVPPNKTGLKDPVWVFNSKNVKGRDITYPAGHNKNNFVKMRIEEHLASKMNKPVSDLIEYIKKIPKSSMPLNNLYKTISKGEEAVLNVDPGSVGAVESDYKIIHSTNDNVEAFINGDKFYILNKNK